MKTAYSLIRFSFTRQELGSSVERQLERHRAECAARKWTFDEKLCIRDLGVSAYRGKNFGQKAALGKFLEASRRGLLPANSVLMVENPDRFSRDVLDNADAELWGLVKRGVDVLFLSNGLLLTKGDENDPAKRAILMFEFYRSHGESARKSDLVSAAVKRMVRRASEGGLVRFGSYTPSWIDYTPDGFRLNQHAETMRGIIAAYTDGESMHAICRRLNAAKTPMLRAGKQWTQGQLSKPLRSEALLGTVTVGGVRLERYYPAVLTDAEWNALQAALAQNRARRGGSQGIANLFRNRVHCAHCGATCHSHDGRYRYYYRCTACTIRQFVRIDYIEQDFFGLYLMESPAELLSKQNGEHGKKVAAAQARIAALEREATALGELLGVLPVDALKAKGTRIQADLEAERAVLVDLARQGALSSHAPGTLSEIRELLQMPEPASFDGAVQAALAIDAAAVRLAEQLKDGETRRKLLHLLPGLVVGLVLDLPAKRYRVKTLAGELTPWRDVA